jgi:hypothetical protein
MNLFQYFPSDPSEYDISNHFSSDVIQDDQRHLTMQLAYQTIRHGDISTASGSADIEWCNDYHGVKVYILCGYNKTDEVPVTITGWTAVHDPRQAVECGRWQEEQLREINAFNGGDGLETDFEYP